MVGRFIYPFFGWTCLFSGFLFAVRFRGCSKTPAKFHQRLRHRGGETWDTDKLFDGETSCSKWNVQKPGKKWDKWSIFYFWLGGEFQPSTGWITNSELSRLPKLFLIWRYVRSVRSEKRFGKRCCLLRKDWKLLDTKKTKNGGLLISFWPS